MVNPISEDQAVIDARANLAQARTDLADALDALAAEAKTAAKTARTKTGQIDLPKVYAYVRALERAEEQLDFAVTDVASSSGQDI